MEKNLKKRILTSIALLLLLFFAFINNYVLGYILMIVAPLSLLEFFGMTSIIFKKQKIKKFLINVIFILYISYFCTFLLTLSFSLYLKILIFVILLTCVASDIGGFTFGKIFKGPKLTKISPKKTLSGMIGSFFLSIIVIYVFFYSSYIHLENINKFSVETLILILLISTVSQIGDITISYFKRLSKIKNTGKIIPGHGGMLDRIDGMIFAFPFSYIIFSLEIIK